MLPTFKKKIFSERENILKAAITGKIAVCNYVVLPLRWLRVLQHSQEIFVELWYRSNSKFGAGLSWPIYLGLSGATIPRK
jgi:hypothetical protein